MRPSAEQLACIAEVYDALLSPGLRVAMLDRLAAHAGANAASLFALDRRYPAPQINVLSSQYNDNTIKQYIEKFGDIELDAFYRFFEFRAFEWKSDCEIYDAPIERQEAAAWIRENYGNYRRSAVRLNENKIWVDGFGLHFPEGRFLIEEREKHFLQPLLPHLAKLVEVDRPFDMLRQLYGAVLAVLDRLRIGVAIVLESGAVAIMNREAERICDLRAGLRLSRDRRLSIDAAQTQARFAKALAMAAGAARGELAHLPGVVTVPRAPEGEPFLLDISPLRGSDTELERGLRAAVVFIIDPQNATAICVDSMQMLFALTDAEASVLDHVVAGAAAPEIAERRNVSVATVRSQLRAIAEKTNTKNRAMLVRLAATVNPPIDRPTANGSSSGSSFRP